MRALQQRVPEISPGFEARPAHFDDLIRAMRRRRIFGEERGKGEAQHTRKIRQWEEGRQSMPGTLEAR